MKEESKSQFLRTAAVILKIEEFGYKSTVSNWMYLAYCCLGAVYFSNKVSKRFRAIYTVLSISALVTLYTQGALYFAYEEAEIIVSLFVVICVVTVFYTHVVIPVTLYIYRFELEETIRIIDETADLEFQPSDSRNRHYELSYAPRLFLFQILSNCCFAGYIVLYLVIHFNDPNKYTTIYAHFVPTSFSLCTSFPRYLVSVFLECFGGAFALFIGSALPAFSTFITCELYNHLEYLNFLVDKESDAISAAVDRAFEKGQLYTVKDNFSKTLRYVTERRMLLFKGIRCYQPFVQYQLMILLAIFFLLQVHYVSVLISEEENILERCKFVGLIISTTTMLFFNCLVGEIFEDMIELYPEAVYNTPWYHLSPERRKLILCYMCIAHEQFSFKALGVYPLNMNMFQRMCNTVYSYANIRRSTLN